MRVALTALLSAALVLTASPSRAIGCHPCILGSSTGSGANEGDRFRWEGTFTGIDAGSGTPKAVTWSFSATGTSSTGQGTMTLYTPSPTAPAVHHSFAFVASATRAGWTFRSEGTVPQWSGAYLQTGSSYTGALIRQDGA